MPPDDERLRPYVASLALTWLRDAPASTWREVEGSLAFVDISGFTRLTERLASRGKAGAEEMSSILDATFAELLGIASSYDGQLVKWGGDALLLLFDGDAHAARACTAADGMRRALRRVGNLRTSVGAVRLQMSVGIHSGSIDFFLVGSQHRELIVTGPAATETARMETIAEAGEIVISPATAALVDRSAVGEPKGAGLLLVRSPGASVVAAEPNARTAGLEPSLHNALPAVIRDFLLAGGSDGEHRHVCVAFVEFSGMDGLLAAEGPVAAASAVDRVVTLCQESARRHGVTFWETDINADGGKVMLVCGAPVAHEDDEDRMLAAAREIIDGSGPLATRIGVNNGRVFSIEFGPPYRRTYSVKGDAVNLAARLMAKAAPGEIFASAGVVARSRGVFTMEPLEPFMVKGKVRPIQAHRVGAARQVRARSAEPPGAASSVMVGRDDELRALAQAWHSARTGTGQCRVVVGPAGSGKSAVVRAALSAARAQGVWLAHGDEYHSTTAYSPFRQLLRDIAAIAESESHSAVLWAMRDAVTERAPELVPWLPLVATVAGIAMAPTPETAMLDDQFRKARREQVTVAVLRTMLPTPCVFVFEDMHLMDDASRDLIRRMMTEVADTPWLVLATSRNDDDAPTPAECLPLLPLSQTDALRAIAALTDDDPLPRHLVTDIATRAGGNPLFLTELVAAVRSNGELIELPSSVEAIIAAQIDALPPPDRALLRSAAVLGMHVDLDVLSAMLSPDGMTTAAHLRELSQFVDLDDDNVRFNRSLARETAYEGLPFSRRKVLHERAAAILESRWSGSSDDIADVLSLHYFHAERYDAAWRFARRAGERAQAVSAHAEAAGLFARALASARHLPQVSHETDLVRVALGDARFRLGDLAGACAAYRGARQGLASDPLQLARMQFKVAQVTDRMGLHAQALRWLSRARRLLEASDDAAAAWLRADIAAQYALVRHFQGREHDAVRWCRQAIEEARRCGNRHAEAAASLYLDVIETLLGVGDGTPAQEALSIWRELGDPWQEARAHNQLGIRAYYAGRWDEALGHYQRARNAADRAGGDWMAAAGAINIAEILSDQGRLVEAQPLLIDALAVWRASGAPTSIAFARSYLGRVAARAGRHDEALAYYAQARDGFVGDGEHAEVLETDARIAECLVLQGRSAAALEAADAAIVRAAGLAGSGAQLPLLHRARGLALAQLGDPVGSHIALQDSLRIARSRNAVHEITWTLDALIQTSPGGSDPDWVRERDRLAQRLGILHIARAPLPRAVVDLTAVGRRDAQGVALTT